QDYFRGLVDERRRRPREDLLSGLVAAEIEGSRLSFDELLAMLLLILVAGNETTTTLIGNAVLELLAHPPALAALRARPELLPDAVEEVLRFSSPIQMDPRREPGHARGAGGAPRAPRPHAQHPARRRRTAAAPPELRLPRSDCPAAGARAGVAGPQSGAPCRDPVCGAATGSGSADATVMAGQPSASPGYP